jgi:hypothetical protein
MPLNFFPSKKLFLLRNIIGAEDKIDTLFILAKCTSITISFDLWMFKETCDVFALGINFLSAN